MTFWDVFFEEGNINTIIGRPKTGKTNVAVDMGFKAIQHGYTVLSNIIFFKPENIEKAKEQGWLSRDIEYVKVPEGFKYISLASELLLKASLTDKNIIIIDEAGITASTYKALSNTAVQMRYLGYSIRKIGGCLIIIAQAKKSVVPDLREELVNYEIHVVRKENNVRSLEILKRMEVYNPSKKEFDIKFLPYDVVENVPLTNLPFDTRSTAGFIWDINLFDVYQDIIIHGYDAVDARKHLPNIIKDLVAEKKLQDFMKRKKFMRTGSVAELLKVSDETVRNWANKGILNCIRDGKGQRLFSLAEVKEFAMKRGLL